MLRSRFGILLVIILCVSSSSCLSTSGPSAVRNEEGVIPPHIANQQRTASNRAGALPPWIVDARPGILTPSEDFTTGEVYGLVHGQGFTLGSRRLTAEQWFLMKDSVSSPHGGAKLTRFPDFLPMVEQVVGHTDKLVWGFGRYPLGNPSPAMRFQEFYDWAVPVVAPKEHGVVYALGLATVVNGIPPDHLDARSGARVLDLDTQGYAETFAVSNGCRFTVFAESAFASFTYSGKEDLPGRFERSRRWLQAWDGKNCSNQFSSGSAAGTATVTDSPRRTYREWRNALEAWNDAEVSYADGVVFIDDDFTGEPLNMQDLEKKLAPLLADK